MVQEELGISDHELPLQQPYVSRKHSYAIRITFSSVNHQFPPFLTKFQNGFSGLFIPLKSRLNYLDLLGNLILNYSHLLSKLISPAFGLLVRTEIISYYSDNIPTNRGIVHQPLYLPVVIQQHNCCYGCNLNYYYYICCTIVYF